ncbi:hypothetical protein JTB14_037148 [Gonioctena quinquepunctata]|nr:hypothetical protein JTB14_037148 [Gonioctena quinquepunctata]
MGFSSSYYEAQKLGLSAIAHDQLTYKPAAFNQLVFDNVYFNVCTVDGHNTVHAMGGIKCVTPSKDVERGSEPPKLGIIPLET